MKLIRLMLISFTGLLLFGCTPKLIVLTDSDGTRYQSSLTTLMDAVDADGLGQLLRVHAELLCVDGEECPGDGYSVLVNYWGKFTIMEDKEVDVIADGRQVLLREEYSYYKEFVEEEWVEEMWFPYTREYFSKVANAQKVEIQIGERKFEVSQKNRVLWKKLLNPLVSE